MTKFYSYEYLKKILTYTSKKHENLQNVLKYFSDDGRWSYTDWTPYYNHNYEKCPDGKGCEELKKSLVYKICANCDDYTHYHCSCSEAIIHPNTFINKYNAKTILIGSKCYRKFGDKANEIMDEFEGKKKCPSCKKTVSKTVVEKYKHEKNIYHMKCYHGQNDTEDDIEEVLPPTPPPSYEETLLNNAEDYEKELLGFGKYKQLTIKEASLNNGVRWYYLEKLPYNEINSLKVKKFVDYLKST